MYPNNNYIYDACVALELLTGLTVSINSRNIRVDTEKKKYEFDGIIDINKHIFTVEIKNELRKEHKSFLIISLEKLQRSTSHPILVIAKYIAADVALELKEKNINYLDVAGNCFIKYQDLFLHIKGQKVHKEEKKKQGNAFQEVGIKIIFNLLSNPDNIQLSYRKLAELTNVSIGSVSNVINELIEQNFILKTKDKRILKNRILLLERWVIAYQSVLRPRLVKKQMSFIKPVTLQHWKELNLSNEQEITLWGSEPAAAILTKNLIPEKFCIYTTQNWTNLGKNLGLVQDEHGSIEVLHAFWKPDQTTIGKNITPPLLIYADLMKNGFGRNIETAKIILENELHHIK